MVDLVLTPFMICGNDGRMASKHTSLNILILDCCREFVYNAKSNTAESRKRGSLAEQTKRKGTVIAHACGPNSRAVDGKGNHGGLRTHRNKNLLSQNVDVEHWYLTLDPFTLHDFLLSI